MISAVMTLLEFVKLLKMSIRLKAIADEKFPWISKDSWILAATVAKGIEWVFPVVGKKRKQTPGHVKALVVGLQLVENKFY
jgi:hypothetical protein